MLSKTDFLWYLDAPMHLWARAHDQIEVKTVTAFEQHLIQQGQQVEALAEQYIQTFLLPKDADLELIWQPSYDDGRFEIRADALLWDRQADLYDLYEIKSSTSIHKDHVYDLAFQVLLLESQINLRQAFIIHINKAYQLEDALDLESFFVVSSLSEKITEQRSTINQLREEAYTITQMPNPKPEFACTKPQSCPCPSLCHPDLPERPIYEIPYIGKKAVTLREMGVTAIEDIPESFNLNTKQRKFQNAVKSGKPIIDCQAIETSLKDLKYPLYFLDYETFNPAVPLFSTYHPYEHIVFQFSLFIIENPGDEPKHYETLITSHEDPAPKLVPRLFNHLKPDGSVIVWNQSFEKNRNQDLAAHCPQFLAQLLGVNDRLFDLMRIFWDGHYVHPDFHGSVSLKAVLPVLCPQMRYEELAISNGEQAMLTWYWLQTGQIPPEEEPALREAMKTYCRLDTYGMIAILEKLQETLRRRNGN